MPFALIVFGILLTVAGIRDKQNDLWPLLKADVDGGFLNWVFAIILVGAFGYVDKLKPISDGFIALLIVALILRAPNVVSSAQQQLSGFGSLNTFDVNAFAANPGGLNFLGEGK